MAVAVVNWLSRAAARLQHSASVVGNLYFRGEDSLRRVLRGLFPRLPSRRRTSLRAGRLTSFPTCRLTSSEVDANSIGVRIDQENPGPDLPMTGRWENAKPGHVQLDGVSRDIGARSSS